MISLATPNGLPADVPESVEEDPSPHFDASELDGIKRYYEHHGYVVVRGLIDAVTCDAMRSLWDKEVKTSTDLIYRQTTCKLERNRLNASGWVMNPVLNIQSLDPKRYPEFRAKAVDQVLDSASLASVLGELLGEEPKIVQSMYFEGNSATWEHQDSYYLDSEHLGSMVGSWIAMEDIAPKAGRFFVCPRTHLLDWKRQGIEDNVADKHDVYIADVIEKFRSSNSSVRAPSLRKGDVLFWNAFLIHGSLASEDSKHSRSSITCHAIPKSHRFMQLQHRVWDVPTTQLRHVSVYAPKDLARLRYRLIFFVESRFPKLFYFAKTAAVKLMVRHVRPA